MKAFLLLLLIAAAASTVSAYPAAPTPTTATVLYPFSKRQYPSTTTDDNSTTNPHIENSYGWCMDITIAGNPTAAEVTIADGSLLSLNETCNTNSTFQQWTLTPYGDNTGEYSIEILGPNETSYCVDVPTAQLNNAGAWLQVWECAYTTNQLWRQNLLNSTDTRGNPGFQLVNVGSNRCLDQSAYDGTTHVAQWGCYPGSPSDITAQTFHQLNCSLSGCNVTGVNPTFVPGGSSSTSTSISTTSSSTSSSSASSSAASNNGDNVTVNSGIVGGTIGGVIVVGIAAGIGIFFCLKKIQRRKAEDTNNNIPEADAGLKKPDANLETGISLKDDADIAGAGIYLSSSKKDLTIYQPNDGKTNDKNFERRNSTSNRKNQIPPTYDDSQIATDSYVLTPIHFNKPEEPDPSEITSETSENTGPSIPSPW